MKKSMILAGLVLVWVMMLSFLGYLIPWVSVLCFVLLCVLTFFLTVRSLSWAVMVLCCELILGSYGYVFSWEGISLRMGLYLMVLAGYGYQLYKKHEERVFLVTFLKKPLVWLVVLVLLFAGIQGFLSYPASAVFADGNAFLYVLLVPVFLRGFSMTLIPWVFSALMVQSFLVLFCVVTFCYRFPFMNVLYKWIRDLRIGEITFFEDGWVRVFFQSQIYLLLGLFFWWGYRKEKWVMWVWSACLLVSFSRSFWMGLFVGMLLYVISICLEPKKLWLFVRKVVGSFVGGGVLLFLLLLPLSQTLWWDVFYRFEPTTQEASAASRWALLAPLWQNIFPHWLLGSGFGASVTYESQDPRIAGRVTTFAFEWGFLDVWLKMGLWGVLLLLFVGGILVFSLWRTHRLIACSVVALFVVHFFTPYLNHPLGLAYMAVLGGLVYKEGGRLV